VESLSDLQPGMVLEGVVTNVAAFGAFVDIGVHQDGLVHVSALAHRFVKDPHDVVKPGQIVKVKVLDVEVKRQRIALTMRLEDGSGQSARPGTTSAGQATQKTTRDHGPAGISSSSRPSQPAGAMALALARAKQKA
jgi:uncharacterized protein